MKVILESKLEKYAWGVMIEAHRKWEKNHGDSLRNAMEWYFNDLYNDQSEEAIKAEVERRLKEEFGDDLNVTQKEYIQARMPEWTPEGIGMSQEDYEMETDLTFEYGELQGEIDGRREELTDTVRDELRNVYYTFFNASEDLTVVFNGEVIQGSQNVYTED